MSTAEFQFGGDGSFKIIVDGHESETTSYEGIAVIEVDGVTYLGVSEYFGGVIPTETVLRLAPSHPDTQATKRCFCNICGKVEIVPVEDRTWMPAHYKVVGGDLDGWGHFNRSYWSCPDHTGVVVDDDAHARHKRLDEKPAKYLYERPAYMDDEATDAEIERRR